MIAKARMKHLGSSAQKTRLVVDQIRGLGVNEAIAVLGGSPKSVAKDVLKVLRSAVANAESGEQRVDADVLYVSRAFVDGGPSLKRVRPATFGRAFRILRRSCHITLELDARAEAAPRLSRAKRRAQAAKAGGRAPKAGKPEPKAAKAGRGAGRKPASKGAPEAESPAEGEKD